MGYNRFITKPWKKGRKTMTAETVTRAESSQKEASMFQAEPHDGIAMEADYREDRPIARLAERQRKFQKSLQGNYEETEMPAS